MPSVQGTLRHEAILDALRRDGSVRVGDLAERLGVSAVTIRADLEYLEAHQHLLRTRGGAVAARPRRFELPLEAAAESRASEKIQIGRHAAGLVRNGETVAIDVGSTTTEMAKALPQGLRDVVVVTNGLNIALALETHPGVTVVVTGGTLRPLQHSLVHPYGATLLKEINVDVAFLGCNGVHPDKGFTNTNLVEAEIKRAMIDSATRAIFLADSAKLMEVATARICALGDADLLVTDRSASPDAVSRLRRAGLEVAVAG